jgi:hypothetical protein
MKNILQSTFKIAFLASLMPYAAMLILLIVVANIGYSEWNLRQQEYGFAAISSYFRGSGWIWTYPNYRHFFIFICVVYQIIYSLKLRTLTFKSYEPSQEITGEQSSKKRKNITAKIFLVLSFFPYVYIIWSAINAASSGFSFMFSRLYGIEAFLSSLFFTSLYLFLIPVLPVCIIYQIVYKITRKRRNTETINTRASRPSIIYIATLIMALLTALLLSIVFVGETLLKTWNENNRIIYFLDNADEVFVTKRGQSNVHVGGIRGTQYNRDVLLINYESKAIAVFSGDITIGFREFELVESEINDKNYKHIQFQEELISPGLLFTAYSLSREHFQTYAFELIMEDGTIYVLNNIHSRLGL